MQGKMLKKCWIKVVIPILVLGTFSLTGSGTSLAATEKKEVTIFTGTAPAFAPVQIAYLKGWFKDYGLDVKFRSFASGAAAMEASRAGKADFFAAGSGCGIVLASRAKDTVVLCPLGFSGENMFVIAPPEVNRPSDLKGKKVTTKLYSDCHYFLGKWLALDGLSLDDIQLVNLSAPDMVAAINRGDVDVMVWSEPYASKREKYFTREVKVVAKNQDAGYLAWGTLFTTRQFAENNPEAVKAVIRACRKAVKWAHANPEETISLLAEYLGIPEDECRILWGNWHHWTITETPGYKLTLQDQAGFMYKNGIIKQKVIVKDIVGTKYLKSVDSDLVVGEE